MANKKKPYFVLETREDFEKWLDEHLSKIGEEQRAKGFEEGTIDVIRIDHFRGFDEYWAVPYGEKTARIGEWRKDHNRKTLKQQLDFNLTIKEPSNEQP